MNSGMMKLMRVSPGQVSAVLLVFFLVYSLLMSVGYPFFAFLFGAFLFICFTHWVVNMPAVRCREGPLYGDDPQGFFEMKVRFTIWLWVAGIITMVIIFSVIVYLEITLPATDPEILPSIGLTGAVIVLMFSLAPFIPATFALMKASYEYDGREIEIVSEVIFIVMFVLCFAIGIEACSIPRDFVMMFYTLPVFPFLPLSICALAASLIITRRLIKSANKSFTEYMESDKE